MSVQRLTLADLIAEVRRGFGEESAGTSELDDTALGRVINGYIQNLTERAGVIGRKLGLPIYSGSLHFDFWKTTVNSTTSAGASNLVVASGSSDIDLPNDYDHWVSWYDRTWMRPMHVITETSRWHYVRKNQSAGDSLIKYVEIRDFYTGGSSAWRRRATLYPAVASGITPSIELVYFRLPASMPNTTPSSEYPDIDPRYQWLPIWGTLVELMRPSDPAHERYRALEEEAIAGMLQSARAA